MGIGGEGIAVVHRGIAIMMSVHMVAAFLVAEVMTEIAVTMIIGGGGLEVGVQDGGEEEAEALLWKGEIGAQLGKAVLREGQRLSSGIGKGNRQKLLTRMVMVTMNLRVMAFRGIEKRIMTPMWITSTRRNMEATTTDPSSGRCTITIV